MVGFRQSLRGSRIAARNAPQALCRRAGRRTVASAVDDAPEQPLSQGDQVNRRQLGCAALTIAALAASTLAAEPAAALQVDAFKKDLTNKRKLMIPESAYTDGPDGLKYYDVIVGTGAEAKFGERVVVHFEAKWRGVTFVTSRQGIGVTGGSPLGFDVGAPPGQGGTLKGLDLGVRGMRVGGRRKLKVPPELAYGKKGFGEVPGDAVLDFDVELLTVKTSSSGYQVKIVEG